MIINGPKPMFYGPSRVVVALVAGGPGVYAAIEMLWEKHLPKI